jgi:hypothetical protein
MNKFKNALFLLGLICSSCLVNACNSDLKLSEKEGVVAASFEKYLAESPFSVKFDHAFYGNIPYGEYDRNVLDLWVSGASKKNGLIVYIHGGGFQGGDKSSAWDAPAKFSIDQESINKFLDEGFSFASINYRLLEGKDKEGVMKSLNDSKRAIQFLRYHSEDLKLNAKEIGLAGTSAGAGTALWLAFHDDMAEANSDDPVLRQSTRVSAVAAQETQSTYDMVKWAEAFPNGMFSIDKIRGTALANRLMNFYGVEDLDELESDRLVEYRAEVDMLSMVSSDDPPVYILNKQGFKPQKGGLVGNLLHSPFHAVALKKEIEKAGIENEIYIPAEGTRPSDAQTMGNFLMNHLKN